MLWLVIFVIVVGFLIAERNNILKFIKEILGKNNE